MNDPERVGEPPADAAQSLRRLIIAAEHYRQSLSHSIGLGSTESQAVSQLAVHGDRGQSELARDLRLTSSAATALVDRLERQGVAVRVAHPQDRRRTIVRLTDRGLQIAAESQRCLAQAIHLLDPEDVSSFIAALTVVGEHLENVARGVEDGRLDPVPTRALPAA